MEDIVSYLVTSGVQHILDGKDGFARLDACFACYLERYIAVNVEDDSNPRQHASYDIAIAELDVADMNTLVKFFRKRIPCKCLDKKYEEVKSITKMGLCANPACSLPDRRVERKNMFRCSGCSRACYCSNECQKIDWSEHKQECKRWAREKAEFESEE